MARPKRQNPMIPLARTLLRQRMPDLADAPMQVRLLDGPPGAPRYAVMVERCLAETCPYGIPAAVAAAGRCPFRDCPLRRSARILLDRDGAVVQSTESGFHWS